MTPSYSEYMELRDIVIRKNAEIERLKNALQLIMRDGCENYTSGPGSCIRTRPAGRGAKYGAEAWCDSCVAYDALEVVR